MYVCLNDGGGGCVQFRVSQMYIRGVWEGLSSKKKEGKKKRMFFLRHASAIHNEEHDKRKEMHLKPHQAATDVKFIDAPLTPSGIEQVIRERDNLVKQLDGKGIDVILVSPLKRTLQTLLYTLPAFYKIPTIHVLSCISELESPEEATLESAPIYNKKDKDPREDLDLLYSPFFALVDFDTYFLKESELLHSRSNQDKLNRFKTLCQTEFKDKRILVVSHHNFIKEVTGVIVGRYKWVSVNTPTPLQSLVHNKS
jgi:broad specificity phosphatase PhoE